MATLTDFVTFNDFSAHCILLFILVAVLLAVSAFVSGSETALFSLTPVDIKRVRESDTGQDRAILALLSDQEYLLATILIANNLVNICIVMLSNNIINELVVFNSTVFEFVVKTVIVTFLLLLFGEIIPKLYTTYNSLPFARNGAPLLLVLRKLLYPFSFVVVKITSRVSGSAPGGKHNLSMDEISNAIEMTSTPTQEEKQMLTGIVSLVNTEVGQIMKPRVDMTALDVTDSYQEVKRLIIESGFSRIPVYEETLDNIKGVLYVKDMLPFIGREDSFDWTRYLRPAYFVPDNKKINDMLEEFQSRKVHIAIVVDEYGSTMGLVSMEDIIEEIVGEISDESDNDESFYTRLDENTYLFDGKTHLVDFAKVTGLDESKLHELSGEAETVAGLMLEIKRDFLKKGESLSVCDAALTVASLEGRRIDKVKVVVNHHE